MKEENQRPRGVVRPESPSAPPKGPPPRPISAKPPSAKLSSGKLRWLPADPGKVEWAKVKWLLRRFIVPGAVGLDLGCGHQKIPGAIGADISGEAKAADHVFDAAFPALHTLPLTDTTPQWLQDLFFRCDYIFSSHFLEDFSWEDMVKVATFYCQYLLREGGYFIAYVPHLGEYKGVNFDHKHEFQPGDMEELFDALKLQTVLTYYEAYHRPGMYGILGVGRKVR